MRQGPPEPVKLPDNQHIAVFCARQRRSQSRPFAGRTRQAVILENLHAACGFKPLELQVEILFFC